MLYVQALYSLLTDNAPCWIVCLIQQPNYVPTLEDEIESQRQKKVEELKKSGKGTKVTPETFAAWQDRKRRRRAEEAKKLVEAEFKKKKGGKGLAVLSGRDLYEYKKDLFEIKDADENDGGESEAAASKLASQPTPDLNAAGDGSTQQDRTVEDVADKVQSDLFLEGDDDDLDDLDDDQILWEKSRLLVGKGFFNSRLVRCTLNKLSCYSENQRPIYSVESINSNTRGDAFCVIDCTSNTTSSESWGQHRELGLVLTTISCNEQLGILQRARTEISYLLLKMT